MRCCCKTWALSLFRCCYHQTVSEERDVRGRVFLGHSDKVSVAAKATVPPLRPGATCARRYQSFHSVGVGTKEVPQTNEPCARRDKGDYYMRATPHQTATDSRSHAHGKTRQKQTSTSDSLTALGLLPLLLPTTIKNGFVNSSSWPGRGRNWSCFRVKGRGCNMCCLPCCCSPAPDLLLKARMSLADV